MKNVFQKTAKRYTNESAHEDQGHIEESRSKTCRRVQVESLRGIHALCILIDKGKSHSEKKRHAG